MGEPGRDWAEDDEIAVEEIPATEQKEIPATEEVAKEEEDDCE